MTEYIACSTDFNDDDDDYDDTGSRQWFEGGGLGGYVHNFVVGIYNNNHNNIEHLFLIMII